MQKKIYQTKEALIDHLAERNDPPDVVRLCRALMKEQLVKEYKKKAPKELSKQIEALAKMIYNLPGIKEISYKENGEKRRIAVGTENGIDEVRLFLYENIIRMKDDAALKVMYEDKGVQRSEKWIICAVSKAEETATE